VADQPGPLAAFLIEASSLLWQPAIARLYQKFFVKRRDGF
jgi:hypothetical protein